MKTNGYKLPGKFEPARILLNTNSLRVSHMAYSFERVDHAVLRTTMTIDDNDTFVAALFCG